MPPPRPAPRACYERAAARLELAVGSASAPRGLLRQNGWAVRDSRGPTRDLGTYQRYLQRSKAEFSVAKHGCVVSHSGWFSERSAAYLASGRPVVTQETGFSARLPSGAGLLAYRSPDEAQAAIEDVSRRYQDHCQAARQVVEAYFEAGAVLSRLVEGALQPPPVPFTPAAARPPGSGR